MGKEKEKKEEKNKRENIIIIILILVLIILLLLLCRCSRLNKDKEDVTDNDRTVSEDKSDKPGQRIDEDCVSKEEIEESINQNKPSYDDGNDVTVIGIKTLKIQEGSKTAEINYINPEQNSGRFYLQISILLYDTGEVLYESGLIPPNKGMKTIELSRQLEKGTYKAVLHIQPYKMNDLAAVNDANLEFEIIVE